MLVQRIPAGAFRCKTNVPVQYIDMLVLRKMDKVAYALAEELEDAGHPSFVTAAQETDWNYKRASYGRLSTRHLGVEAGLGTLGPRGEHPHPRVRPAHLSHRHPHRAGARGRQADHRAGLHRGILQPLPAFLPGRRGAAFRHRQARLRRPKRRSSASRPSCSSSSASSTRRTRRKPRWRVRAMCSASGRGCCASSARSAIARAASRSARSATTITRISPMCRRRFRKRRPRRSRSARPTRTAAREAMPSRAWTNGTAAGSGRRATRASWRASFRSSKRQQVARGERKAEPALADERD